MWKVSHIICLGILSGISVVDVMFRKVPQELLILCSAGVVVYQIIFRTTDTWLLFGGAGVGGFFFLMSKVTGEGIGYGDSWGILILGLYMGLWQVIGVLAAAFALFIPAGMICLMTGRLSRKVSFPFYPFLTGGYVLILLTGVG